MDERTPEDRSAEDEQPHDILAAEAFSVGAGDPRLHREAARDVLAADEFPVPAPEPHAVPPELQGRSRSSASVQAPEPRRPRRGRLLVAGGLAGVALLRWARRRRAGG